jgi:prevent-host-death family protein
MKEVSYQVLKRNLSSCLDRAEAGEELVVTRHRKPVAVLSSARREHVRVGRRFGKGRLTPLFSEAATAGKYLAALIDDRRGTSER